MSYDEILTEVRDFEEILLDPRTFYAHNTEDFFFEKTFSLLKILFKYLPVFTPSYTSLPTQKEHALPKYHFQEKYSQSCVLLILRYLVELPTSTFTQEQWGAFTDVCLSSKMLFQILLFYSSRNSVVILCLYPEFQNF